MLVAIALHVFAGTAWATFVAEPGSPITVGSEPGGVVAADFNGDTLPDAAVVNWTSSTVTMLLRQSGGGFSAEAGGDIDVGEGPNFAASADFDADTRLDLAVASFSDSNVATLLRKATNDGFNTGFTAGPGRLVGVATADFDGDRRPDLALGDWDLGKAAILLRKPTNDGFAAEASPPSTGTHPGYVSAADFNGDGRPDLAVANRGVEGMPSNLSLLLRKATNDGFVPEASSPIPVGDTPYAVVSADFSGDGRADLAVSNLGDNNVTILLRTAANNGFAPEGSPIPVGASPRGLATGDFNGDGLPDLAVASSTSRTATILLRNPGGGFTPDPSSPFYLGTGASAIAAADFNRDARVDLVVTDGLNAVHVLLNTTPPDSDHDGVPDPQDACPSQPASTPNGCPDTTLIVDPPEIAGRRSAGSVKVKRNGRFTLRTTVDCTGAGPDCAARTTTSGRAGKSRSSRTIRMGTAIQTVRAGTTARVKGKLSKKGRRALKRARRIRAKVKIAVTRGAAVASRTINVTLNAPRRR